MSTSPYVVQQGDCLSSIAARFGYEGWQVLWNDPGNEALRNKRRSPNVLYPGDEVALPAVARKKVTLQPNADHVVQVTKATTRLRVRLVNGAAAVSNAPYQLLYGGRIVRGTTDGDGVVDQVVPFDLASAQLSVVSLGLDVQLLIGHLDPADTPEGAGARLGALGLYGGAPDDAPALSDGLHAFQAGQQLHPDGQLNDGTVAALEKSYGA